MADSVIRSRVAPELKDEAQKVLESMGLTMSEAIRIFLTQTVAQGCLPFVVKAPNAETSAAMQQALSGELEHTSLEQLAEEWGEACGK